jgi:hypothetical protein
VTEGNLPEAPVESLFEDHLGQFWITAHSRVAVLKSGRVVAVSSMPYGVVFSIAEERSGHVWMSHQEALLRLREGRVLERIPWSSVADFTNGQVRAWYGRSEGLPDG